MSRAERKTQNTKKFQYSKSTKKNQCSILLLINYYMSLMLIMSYFANTRKVIAMLLHLSLPYLSFRTAPASLPLSSSQYLGSPSKSLVEPVRPSHTRALLLPRENSLSRSHPPVPVLPTRALPFRKLQSLQRLYLCYWYHS